MNKKEMTELNLWIAEHVMGAKWCDNLLILDGVIFFKRGKRGKEFTPIGYPRGNFIPTTDPAAALSVLEKCAMRGRVSEHNILIFQSADGSNAWAVGAEFVYAKDEIDPEYAGTLPLAICLFAKKLFSK